MTKNYFKVSRRSLIRQKVFSIINILGLVVTLATSVLIFTYILYERSYGKFVPGLDQVYRITNGKNGSHTPFRLASAIRTEMPTVESGTWIYLWEALVKIGNKSYRTPLGSPSLSNSFHSLLFFEKGKINTSL